MFAPEGVTAVSGTGFTVSAELIDPDESDIVTAAASASMPGLFLESGKTPDGRTIATLRGIIPLTVSPGEYTITWTASDGVNPPVQRRTKVRTTKPLKADGSLEERVENFVNGRYLYGIPERTARELGRDALPLLAKLLRDDRHKGDWANILGTMATIATPEMFDSLRAFVWDRFSGEIDDQTFDAILAAHEAIWNVVATRPEVVDYLELTANPEAWSAAPWRLRVGNMRSLAISLSGISINGLSCIVTPRAIAILEQLRLKPYLPDHVPNIDEGIERQTRILRIGREAAWREDLRRWQENK